MFDKYSGGAIGDIVKINENEFLLMTDERTIVHISYEKILKLQKATKDENFNNVPYYDEQEKEFWKPHCITEMGSGN